MQAKNWFDSVFFYGKYLVNIHIYVGKGWGGAIPLYLSEPPSVCRELVYIYLD